jgi:hypothetical protein
MQVTCKQLIMMFDRPRFAYYLASYLLGLTSISGSIYNTKAELSEVIKLFCKGMLKAVE